MAEENKKVSIIIPTYNRENFVERAINSALNQTYKDIEVLVVDDGSTDNTKEVVGNIKDDRLRYFYKENGGVSSARNFALDRLEGEYVAFLDSDDYYENEKIKKQLDVLNANSDFNIAYHPCKLVDDSGTVLKHIRGKLPEGIIIKPYILHGMASLYIGSLLIKEEVLRDLRFNEEMVLSEDVGFIYHLAVTNKFKPLSEFLYSIVEHDEEGLTKNISLKDFNNLEFLIEDFEKSLDTLNGNKDLLKIAKSEMFYMTAKMYLRSDFNLRDFYRNLIKSFFLYPFNLKVLKLLINPLKVLKHKK